METKGTMKISDALEELKTWILYNVCEDITCKQIRSKFELLDDARNMILVSNDPVYPEKNRSGVTVCGNCRVPFGNGFAYDKWSFCPRCGRKIGGVSAETQEAI